MAHTAFLHREPFSVKRRWGSLGISRRKLYENSRKIFWKSTSCSRGNIPAPCLKVSICPSLLNGFRDTEFSSLICCVSYDSSAQLRSSNSQMPSFSSPFPSRLINTVPLPLSLRCLTPDFGVLGILAPLIQLDGSLLTPTQLLLFWPSTRPISLGYSNLLRL